LHGSDLGADREAGSRPLAASEGVFRADRRAPGRPGGPATGTARLRGGAERRVGWVSVRTTPRRRDRVASAPPSQEGSVSLLSPPRRGGVARSDGVVGFAGFRRSDGAASRL